MSARDPARWRHRALVLEAMAGIAAASLALRFVPVRLLLKPSAPRSRADAAVPRAQRVAAAMQGATRRAPWLGLCLAQALALRWMLARRGIACDIHLSVGPTGPASRLKGHAWISLGPVVLYGKGPPRGQVRIFSRR